MIARPVVDLPQPDSPTRPSVSPRTTSKLTPDTAWTVRPAAGGELDDEVLDPAGRRVGVVAEVGLAGGRRRVRSIAATAISLQPVEHGHGALDVAHDRVVAHGRPAAVRPADRLARQRGLALRACRPGRSTRARGRAGPTARARGPRRGSGPGRSGSGARTGTRRAGARGRAAAR